MNEKLILVKAIMLLYRESLVLSNKDESTPDIIRKSLEQIKKSEVSIGITREVDIISNLKNEVLEMLNNPASHQYIEEDLLSRLKLLTSTDESTYEALYDGITINLDEFKLKQAIHNDRRSLASFNNSNLSIVL